MEIKIGDFGKLNKELLPVHELKIESPNIRKFDYGFLVSADLDFLNLTVNSSQFLDEIRADWKEVEKFSFKHMDIDATFKDIIRKV